LQILQKIKSNSDYKRLFENFISLSILQGLNYILPLVTFPYLVRVLGVEKFGLLSFATATIAYFQILTDYGFNLSATREVAINRDNKEKLNEIFSSVMIIKFGLLIISFLLLSVLVFSFEKFRQDWLVYYLSFGMVVGQVLFPVWFFQGMERMRYITILNAVAKGIFTIAIFVFVKSQSDYWKVPLLNSIGFLIAGFIGVNYAKKIIKFKLIRPIWSDIKEYLINGFPLFLSLAAIPFFNQANIIVLGFVYDNTVVAYYSLASQIIGILISSQVPVVNTIFPKVANDLYVNKNKALIFLKKITKYGVYIYILLALALIIFGKILIKLFFGSAMINAYMPVAIMGIVPLITFLANIYGNQILINLGKYNYYARALISAAFVNTISIFPFVYFLGSNGAALSRICSETIILIIVYFYSRVVLKERNS